MGPGGQGIGRQAGLSSTRSTFGPCGATKAQPLWQNITLALGIKSVFLLLAVFGTATMWMAVFADMRASLLVVPNGLRLLRDKKYAP